MKYLNYILIIVGAFIAMYAKTGTDQNQFVLISGVVVLMIGIYRISRKIPSKYDDEDFDNPENE